MNREVGAYDAKTKLPELLRAVARGERFTITHRGRPIADLVPSASPARPAKEAIAAMAAFPRIRGVSAEQVAEFVAEGRR